MTTNFTFCRHLPSFAVFCRHLPSVTHPKCCNFVLGKGNSLPSDKKALRAAKLSTLISKLSTLHLCLY